MSLLDAQYFSSHGPYGSQHLISCINFEKLYTFRQTQMVRTALQALPAPIHFIPAGQKSFVEKIYKWSNQYEYNIVQTSLIGQSSLCADISTKTHINPTPRARSSSTRPLIVLSRETTKGSARCPFRNFQWNTPRRRRRRNRRRRDFKQSPNNWVTKMRYCDVEINDRFISRLPFFSNC